VNDDSEIVDPKSAAPDGRYGETLLYDFAKFLTTLSLFALSGVLALTQAADRSDVKLFNMLMVLGAIALAGILSISTANALVDARSTGKEPHPRLASVIKAAMGLLGVGTGGFIYMWWDSLL
jgi:hypothetical protein